MPIEQYIEIPGWEAQRSLQREVYNNKLRWSLQVRRQNCYSDCYWCERRIEQVKKLKVGKIGYSWWQGDTHELVSLLEGLGVSRLYPHLRTYHNFNCLKLFFGGEKVCPVCGKEIKACPRCGKTPSGIGKHAVACIDGEIFDCKLGKNGEVRISIDFRPYILDNHLYVSGRYVNDVVVTRDDIDKIYKILEIYRREWGFTPAEDDYDWQKFVQGSSNFLGKIILEGKKSIKEWQLWFEENTKEEHTYLHVWHDKSLPLKVLEQFSKEEECHGWCSGCNNLLPWSIF